MSLTIPTLSDEPYHTLRVRLDDRDYTLELSYSTRGNTYSLHMFDEENEPLIYGLKLFCGVSLLDYYQRDERVPPGVLMVIALTGDQSPPKLGELGEGSRCELSYFTLTEFTALALATAAT